MKQLNIGTYPLEESLATLENAKHVLATPSGMTAIQTVFQTFLTPGDHILVNEDMYSGTLKLLRTLYVDMNISCDKIDMSDLEAVEKSITSKTRIVLLESPSNPMMRIYDFASIVRITRKLNQDTLIVVDNTIMTSVLQNPLELGTDIVLYSLTKYQNGHQDIFMGSIVTNDSDIFEKLKITRHWNGFIPSQWDCSMVERGLKTLRIRLTKHESNAKKVIDFLKVSPFVEQVFSVGLQSTDESWAARQMNGSNGMVSFRLNGDSEFAINFLKKLKIIMVGESYAGFESLICIPAVMTHHNVPKEDRLHVGMTDNLIRLSVGLEDPEDLIVDMNRAFILANQESVRRQE
ncbi:CTH.2 family protein [Megaselia abdita]